MIRFYLGNRQKLPRIRQLKRGEKLSRLSLRGCPLAAGSFHGDKPPNLFEPLPLRGSEPESLCACEAPDLRVCKFLRLSG